MSWKGYCVSQRGKVRPDNQDCLGYSSELSGQVVRKAGAFTWVGDAPRLLCVADGVAGNPGGRIAADTAVMALFEAFSLMLEDKLASLNLVLTEAMVYAHRSVLRKASLYPELWGMATTLVAGVIAGQNLTLGWVGDSRAYRLNTSGLHLLTQDHTIKMRIPGQTHSCSLLTRCVGQTQEECLPEVIGIDLADDDRLLFCSDGVHGCLSEVFIEKVLKNRSLADGGTLLSDAILRAGAPDNFSFFLLEQS